MNCTIVSDIHGNFPYLRRYVEVFDTELNCTKVSYSTKNPLGTNSSDGDISRGDEHLDLYYQTTTSIDDSGLQLWGAGLIMADWILGNISLFHGTSVIELGCGLGLLSILLSATTRVVYPTDNNELTLKYCHHNVKENVHDKRTIRVRKFDWNICVTGNADIMTVDEAYRLTTEDIKHISGGIDYIVASDVAYDEEAIDNLMSTVHDLLLINKRAKAVIFVQSRIILSYLNVECAPHFDHFRKCLEELNLYEPELSNVKFIVDEINTDEVDQYLQYQLRPRDVYGFIIRTEITELI